MAEQEYGMNREAREAERLQGAEEVDPVELLSDDHEKVMALFQEFQFADSGERIRVAKEIHAERMIHTQIEEEIFYPAVRESGAEDAAEVVSEAIGEHTGVKALLKEMQGLDPAGDEYAGRMTALREMVEHHVEEEETEMFGLAEGFSDDLLSKIGARMATRRDQLRRS
jgi:hemerythrin superfamily protein